MRVVWISLGVLTAAAAVGVYQAGLDERQPPPSNPGIVFHAGVAHGQRLTSRSWSVDYERAVSNADQTVFDLENVKHGVIYKNGRAYLRVRATHMSVCTLSHDCTAAGPLHVETSGASPQRIFDTSSAVWNDAIQRLTLAHPSIVHTAGQGPLSVGSLIFNVKTGDIEIRSISGALPVK